ncbi:MAG: flagellar brake protein [Desulfobacterota bacterium]|nr:flagellar brake protein [Thermodesulfobacteriota bacterium]
MLLLHADRIDDPDDILLMLKTIMQEKARLKIHCNDRRRTYTSSLLVIDPSTLLIDELFPAEGNERIRESNFITVDFSLRNPEGQRLHLSYSFPSTYVADEQWHGLPAIRIAFPTLITRNQKRSYLRVSPPVNEPLFIRYVVQGREHIDKIVNISASGARFYTNLGKSVLAPGTHLDDVRIDIPNGGSISCSAVVRTLHHNEQPVIINGKQVFFSCGIEFIGLSDAVRDNIVKYALLRERQELKYLTREFA